jgi:hypothetical protein
VFNLPQLATIAQNVLDGNAELNPSITTWLHDRNGEVARELFLNQATLADVTLQVEEETIDAHKALLGARCNVLKAMFGSGFAEGLAFGPWPRILTGSLGGSGKRSVRIEETSADTMRQLVEYLYSGHVHDLDSDETDVVGVMALANRYGLPHLVSLCELYVSKQIERATAQEVIKADIDVIGLLLTAQSLNATQLAAFCLHFLSTKYDVVSAILMLTPLLASS